MGGGARLLLQRVAAEEQLLQRGHRAHLRGEEEEEVFADGPHDGVLRPLAQHIRVDAVDLLQCELHLQHTPGAVLAAEGASKDQMARLRFASFSVMATGMYHS